MRKTLIRLGLAAVMAAAVSFPANASSASASDNPIAANPALLVDTSPQMAALVDKEANVTAPMAIVINEAVVLRGTANENTEVKTDVSLAVAGRSNDTKLTRAMTKSRTVAGAITLSPTLMRGDPAQLGSVLRC